MGSGCIFGGLLRTSSDAEAVVVGKEEEHDMEKQAVVQLRPAKGCIGVPHQHVEDRQGLVP